MATAAAWGGDVEITLNDANPCVATRNVILLRLLRKGETEAARQLWADAWLDGKSAALVTRELQTIALGVNDDAGVRVRKGSRADIQRCASAWLDERLDAKEHEHARARDAAQRLVDLPPPAVGLVGSRTGRWTDWVSRFSTKMRFFINLWYIINDL